jgi:hypothetical protein
MLRVNAVSCWGCCSRNTTACFRPLGHARSLFSRHLFTPSTNPIFYYLTARRSQCPALTLPHFPFLDRRPLFRLIRSTNTWASPYTSSAASGESEVGPCEKPRFMTRGRRTSSEGEAELLSLDQPTPQHLWLYFPIIVSVIMTACFFHECRLNPFCFDSWPTKCLSIL